MIKPLAGGLVLGLVVGLFNNLVLTPRFRDFNKMSPASGRSLVVGRFYARTLVNLAVLFLVFALGLGAPGVLGGLAGLLVSGSVALVVNLRCGRGAGRK